MRLWLLLNSVGLVVVGAVLYLTLRQIGFVLSRVGPSGARGSADGPRVGENVSYFLAQVAGLELPAKARLIVFGSEACSVCAHVRSGAEELARRWKRDADILLIYDCDADRGASPVQTVAAGLYFMRDCALRGRLGATFVPFAMMVDESGAVLGKGLVNEIGHLESLLELQRSKTIPVSGEFAASGAQI